MQNPHHEVSHENEEFDCPMLLISRPGQRLSLGDSEECSVVLHRDMPVTASNMCEWCAVTTGAGEGGSLQLTLPQPQETKAFGKSPSQRKSRVQTGTPLMVLINGAPVQQQSHTLEHLDVISFSESSTQLVVVLPKKVQSNCGKSMSMKMNASKARKSVAARKSVFNAGRKSQFQKARMTNVFMHAQLHADDDDDEEGSSNLAKMLKGRGMASVRDAGCDSSGREKKGISSKCMRSLFAKFKKNAVSNKQLSVEDGQMLTDQFDEVWKAVTIHETEDRIEDLRIVYTNLRKQILDIAKRSGVNNALHILSNIKTGMEEIERANAIVTYLKPKIKFKIENDEIDSDDEHIEHVSEERNLQVTHIEPRLLLGLWHIAATQARLTSIEDAGHLAKNLFSVSICCEGISDVMVWTYDEFEQRLEWMEDVQAKIQEQQQIHDAFFGNKTAQRAVAKMGVRISAEARDRIPEENAGDWLLENPGQNPFQPMTQELASLIGSGSGGGSAYSEQAMIYKNKADRLQQKLNQALNDLANSLQDNRNIRWHLAVRDKELLVEKELHEQSKEAMQQMDSMLRREEEPMEIAKEWLKELNDDFTASAFTENIAKMRDEVTQDQSLSFKYEQGATLSASSVFLALADSVKARFEGQKEQVELFQNQVVALEKKKAQAVVQSFLRNVDDTPTNAAKSLKTNDHALKEDVRLMSTRLRELQADKNALEKEVQRLRFESAVMDYSIVPSKQPSTGETPEAPKAVSRPQSPRVRPQSPRLMPVTPVHVQKGRPEEYGGCLFVTPSQNDCGWRRIAAAVNVWRSEVEKPLKKQLDVLTSKDCEGLSEPTVSTRASPAWQGQRDSNTPWSMASPTPTTPFRGMPEDMANEVDGTFAGEGAAKHVPRCRSSMR